MVINQKFNELPGVGEQLLTNVFRNRSFVISESETGRALMRELSHPWKFGRPSVAGLAGH
jgi:hypothetical protein